MPNTTGSGDAVFNEMLQFTVDVDQFATDLKQIEAQWDESLTRMSESTEASGFKATDLFDPKAVENQLQGLQSTIQELATSIGNAFGTLTKNINEQLDEVQAKAEKIKTEMEGMGLDATGGNVPGAGKFGATLTEEELAMRSAGGGRGGSGSGMHPRVRSFGFGESTGNFFGDLAQGFAGSQVSMGQMIGAMTRFMLMWQAVQLVIRGVVDSIMLIPRALESVIEGGFAYMDRLDERHSALIEKVKEYAARWEGIVASPVFREIDDILAKIAEWFQKNKPLLDAFAESFGKSLKGVFDSLKDLGKDNMGGLVSVLRLMVVATANALSNIRDMADVLDTFLKFREHNSVRGFVNNSLGLGPKTDVIPFSDMLKELDEKQKKNAADRNAMVGSFDDLAAGRGQGVKNDFPLLGDDNLRDLKAKFEKEYAIIKEAYDKKRKEIESFVKHHQESVQDSEPQIRKSYVDEGNALDNLIEKMKAHAHQTGQNRKQVEAFRESLDKTASTFRHGRDSKLGSLDDRAYAESEAQNKLSIDTKLKMTELDAQSEISIARKLAQEKIITEETAQDRILKAEQTVHEAKIATWTADREMFGENTTNYKKLTAEIAEEDLSWSTKQVEAEHAKDAARRQYLETSRKLLEAEKGLAVSAAQNQLTSDKTSGSSAFDVHQDTVAVAQAKLAETYQKELNARARLAEANEKDEQEVERLTIAYQQAVQNTVAASDTLSHVSAEGGLSQKLFGNDSLSGAFKDTTTTAKSLNTSFKELNTAVQTIQNGFKQGGLLGGLGAIGSVGGGFMSDIGKSLGDGSAIGSFMSMAGPIAGAAGTLFSILGGVFANAAKQIAADVEKSYKKIMSDYQAGNTDFSTTMANLEKERQDAISRLGGKKKGKSELQGILDQIDQSEQQISQHAQQVRKSFEEQLVIISQGNKVAQDWVKTWTDINKQVKEYMDNGGNALYAHQYLQQQFNQQLADLQSQYNDGEEQAIQDAFKMNDLLDQRAKIQDEINKLTKKEDDSIERREAGAITANRDLADQKKTLQDQLDKNKQDLDVATAKWTKEQQLFGLTGDINQLHKLDAELQIKSLQDQLDKWSSIKYIIDQIHAEMAAGFNPASSFSGGLFAGVSPIQGLDPGGIPGFGAAGAPTYNIVVHPPYGVEHPYNYGRNVGGGIADELYYRRRGGMSL